MSEMVSEWSFVSFTAWLRSMYSLTCFLQSSENSGFFANLFSNDWHRFYARIRLLGSFRDSLFHSKGIRKRPSFNIALFSNICRACCSVGDGQFGSNLERVPYDSICQKCLIYLDNDSSDILVRWLHQFPFSPLLLFE